MIESCSDSNAETVDPCDDDNAIDKTVSPVAHGRLRLCLSARWVSIEMKERRWKPPLEDMEMYNSIKVTTRVKRRVEFELGTIGVEWSDTEPLMLGGNGCRAVCMDRGTRTGVA